MLSAQVRSSIVESDWFETSWAPWVLLDTDLVIRAVNGALERELGLARDQVTGRPVFDVFPENPADPIGAQERLAASLEHVLRTGRRLWRGVQRYDLPSPASLDAFVHRIWMPVLVPVREDGRTVGVLINSQDVTVPLSTADRAAFEAFRPGELEAAAELLLSQFPGAAPSLVLSTLAHSQRRVLEATGTPDSRSATDLARLRLEARTGHPALAVEGDA